MRVGIVGAGMSGLAAARTLKQGGHEAVIFEKSDHVGGRCATKVVGPYIFDPGATGLTPRQTPLAQVMTAELDTSDLVQISKPIYTHQGLRVFPGDPIKNAVPRYTYRTGNIRLPQLLADGLDVRLSTAIEGLEKLRDGYRLAGEEFDAIVLTPPVPQTAAILWTIGESRAFANVRYRPCLSILLGYAQPAPDVHYHALLDPEQRHPITWLSIESIKSPDRAPEGHCAMVVQFSPPYSLNHFADSDEHIVDDCMDYVRQLYGSDWDKLDVAEVKRWKYSQPETTGLFDSVNPHGAKLLIAGDGVLAGRVEGAYECGVKAARLLVGETAKV